MPERTSVSTLQAIYTLYARLGIYDLGNRFMLTSENSRNRRRLVSALRIGPGDRVLDVACGTGLGFATLGAVLGREGSIVGIDVTRAMLARAKLRVERNRWANVQLIEGDAARLPFEDASFSAVCSTLALGLVTDWEGAVREAWRVLRPGGRIAILDGAPFTGWRRVLAPAFNSFNHYVAGWQPPGPDVVGAFEALTPRTGMERLPPLGVWVLLWAEKESTDQLPAISLEAQQEATAAARRANEVPLIAGRAISGFGP